MPLIDTLTERFPNLDLTHRDTIHRLADRLGRGNVPAVTNATAIPNSKGNTRPTKTTSWDETGKYPHSKRVGPYLLGKVLGEGSFAKVKEAMHSVVGEKVAIKIVDKRTIRDDVYLRKNMRREAAILQTLHHPNIVRLYEVMETDNNFYMVLELCTGGPVLDKICREGKLTEETVRRYVRQMLSAIDHMHQAGVLHRDLKVENLLLDDTGNIKIIDFGLSNFLGSLSRGGGNGRLRTDLQATQCGSPAYAAPEIIANKRYGAKVDVWSVGVNTFAMLTGTLPFIVEPFNIKVLLRKMMTKDMTQMPRYVSKECQEFIKNLLQPDPRARPSVRDVLSHHWLSDGRPTSSCRPRTATPTGRLSRMEVDTDIVNFIWNTYGIQPSHVTNSVICKRADEYSAIYFLLIRTRDREDVERMRVEFNSKDKDRSNHVTETEFGNNDRQTGHIDDEHGKEGDKDMLAEMTALQLAGRKHGSMHFKVTTLDLNNEALETPEPHDPLDNHVSGENTVHPSVEIPNPDGSSAVVDSVNGNETDANKTVQVSAVNRQETIATHTDGNQHTQHGIDVKQQNPTAATILKNGKDAPTVTDNNRSNNADAATNSKGVKNALPGANSTGHDTFGKSNGKDEKKPADATDSKSKGNDQRAKIRQFRQAFTSAKTSGIAKRQLDRRRSDIRAGTFHNKTRKSLPRGSMNRTDDGKMVNCAHKVNLTFRQSDPGGNESFAEHFNFRRRKRNSSRPEMNPYGLASIKLNLTPVYSPAPSPKKHVKPRKKLHVGDMDSTNTIITIKHQKNPNNEVKARQTTLSKLIDDVQVANAPSACDAISLSHAQKEAMATFRTTRGQKKKQVPPEFEQLQSTRMVKVAKRKSIDVSANKMAGSNGNGKRASPQNRHGSSVVQATSRPTRRRKLSMEETLERYRSRVPVRSPCMCQPPKTAEKTSNAWSSEKPKVLKAHPDVSPPLVARSPRLKPITHQSV